MDKGTEVFIREFFLKTKTLSDKELSSFIDNEEYKNITHFDETKGHLDVIFEIIANERHINLEKLTQDFDYVEPEDRERIEHRIVIVFTNSTYTEVNKKIIRLKHKSGYHSHQIVEAYLKNKNLNYTYQNNGVVEYIHKDIHNINQVYYVYLDELECSVFDVSPKNREDALIWLEHLNKLYILSISKEFSQKIESKKSFLKKIAKR